MASSICFVWQFHALRHTFLIFFFLVREIGPIIQLECFRPVFDGSIYMIDYMIDPFIWSIHLYDRSWSNLIKYHHFSKHLVHKSLLLTKCYLFGPDCEKRKNAPARQLRQHRPGWGVTKKKRKNTPLRGNCTTVHIWVGNPIIQSKRHHPIIQSNHPIQFFHAPQTPKVW